MSTFRVRLLCTWLAVSLVGCSSLRPVADWSADRPPEVQARSLHAGDIVEVATPSGTSQRLVVTAVEADAVVVASADRSASQRVPFDRIQRVETRQFDGLRTALLVVGLTTALVYFALSHVAFMPGP
jgi:hypothetical protein